MANPNTSATFATILVRFLLDRLDEMGSEYLTCTVLLSENNLKGHVAVSHLLVFYGHTANMERSNLYLKLFKLVFGSVSLFASENEQMLKVCDLLA